MMIDPRDYLETPLKELVIRRFVLNNEIETQRHKWNTMFELQYKEQITELTILGEIIATKFGHI